MSIELEQILSEIEERANKATLGPWKKCTASDGKCRCQDIWSIPADAPVCSCNDKWGDGYASLRFVEGESQGSIGAKVEAYEAMIEYGDLGDAAKQANKNFIASARTDVPALVKALRESRIRYLVEVGADSWEHKDFDAKITAILNQGRSVGDNKRP